MSVDHYRHAFSKCYNFVCKFFKLILLAAQMLYLKCNSIVLIRMLGSLNFDTG